MESDSKLFDKSINRKSLIFKSKQMNQSDSEINFNDTFFNIPNNNLTKQRFFQKPLHDRTNHKIDEYALDLFKSINQNQNNPFLVGHHDILKN